VDCRQCDDTLQKLKNVEWDKHEIEQERDQVVKQSSRVIRYLSVKHIRIPENNELERMFP
jgi:hypothetical protein